MAILYKFTLTFLEFRTSYRWVGDGDVRGFPSLDVLLKDVLFLQEGVSREFRCHQLRETVLGPPLGQRKRLCRLDSYIDTS